MTDRMIKPALLKEGDTVAVVAPSGLVEKETIEEAIDTIASWGLTARRGKSLYERHGIFAGSDDQRYADLQQALDDSSVRAVFCARGGYGMSRIISRIDFSAFKKNPKWIIGYSDITVLHMYINCRLGISTIHGEMLLNYHRNEPGSETLRSLKDVLFEKPHDQEWKPELSRDGVAQGIIVGGNLSLVSNLMGTDLKDCLEGKILFLEERGEYFYSLDRMITGLKLAGVLRNLKGLVIGGLTGIKQSSVEYTLGEREVVMDGVTGYSYPVAFDFPAGHIADNRAFVLGGSVRLEVREGRAGVVNSD